MQLRLSDRRGVAGFDMLSHRCTAKNVQDSIGKMCYNQIIMSIIQTANKPFPFFCAATSSAGLARSVCTAEQSALCKLNARKTVRGGEGDSQSLNRFPLFAQLYLK